MAGGDRAQERDCRFGDCQTQKAVKLSYSAALLSWTVDCKYWPLALTLSSKTHQTYQTYQTHDNLLRLLDSFALCMPGKHRQHTTNQPTHKQQHSKINNNNNNNKTTYKQQQTNISHSSKDPGEPLYNHAGHSFFWSSLVTSILHHHRLPILFISQVYQNSMPFLDTVCACVFIIKLVWCTCKMVV